MNKNLILLSLLKGEFYKTKRNMGRWTLFSFPVIITLCIDLYIFIHAKEIANDMGYNPWIYLLGRYIFQFYALLYPIIAAIFCFSYCDAEYKNNNLHDLFTFPVSKTAIFFAKILYLIENLIVSLLLAYSLFLISGFVMSYVFPDWGFQDYNIKLITFIYFSKIFCGLAAVCLIQFFMSLVFKQFVVPVGFACGITLFSVIFYKWKYIDFVPYNECSVALSDYMQEVIHFFDKTDWINISYVFAFLLFSYLIFQKK